MVILIFLLNDTATAQLAPCSPPARRAPARRLPTPSAATATRTHRACSTKVSFHRTRPFSHSHTSPIWSLSLITTSPATPPPPPPPPCANSQERSRHGRQQEVHLNVFLHSRTLAPLTAIAHAWTPFVEFASLIPCRSRRPARNITDLWFVSCVDAACTYVSSSHMCKMNIILST